MKIAPGRRQRILFLWLARLALFAYAFQISAADHWHQDTIGGTGLAGHQMHCHVDLASCAEQPGFMGSMVQNRLPSIAVGAAFEAPMLASLAIPSSAFIASADESPRFF